MTDVTVKAAKDGPLLVEIDGKQTHALCRCGKAVDKLNCDGTHTKVGFEAEPSEIKLLDK